MHRAKYLEFIGLFILLVAIGWQLFIEEDAKSQVTNGQMLILNEKINTAWRYLGVLGSDIHANEKFNAHNDANRYFQATETFLGLWPTQAKWFARIRAILYLIGSAFLLGGKYVEYQVRLLESRISDSPMK